MDRGTVDRIEEWEARPFSGGYAGLHDLADAEFSGAVTDGTAWLFMLNGRVVGVFHGTVSTFEGAEGSAYEAPHPALVLLFAMRERGGETRAQYYTDDTPLSEVDGTLSEGSFTGYVELSENVLSGDYYVVYYGGRSMSVAFIGSSERVVTGDEAFERANDEVGIYEVKSVDLEVQDIPEPADEPEPDPDPEPADEPEPDPEPTGDPDPSDEPTSEPEPEPEPTSGTEAEPDPDPEPVDDPATAEPDAGVESGRTDDGEAADAPEPNPGPVADAGVEAQGTDQDPFSEEEEWRQTRTVPALDPEETEVETEREEPTTGGTDERERPDSAEAAVQSGEEDTRDGAVEDRIVELETALDSREDEIEQLQERVESVIAERDRLEEERDRLEERVERLESGSGSTGSTAGKRLDPTEALTRTDLFVRYESKGEATLEKAHGGEATAEEVNANLRLETHTRFDTGEVTVDERPFEEFLTRTVEYRFVDWTVNDLLYEIQGTDSQRALRDLYDALPRIDRAEFNGDVAFETEDGGERERSFDVVLRDRMGQPLIVADINDARDPATDEMMADLVEGATAVGESHETLGAAFLVTSSFFEPGALETANEATGGGFLNRETKKSFVRLSRKQGYHLCLIEARGDAFHVAVPEL